MVKQRPSAGYQLALLALAAAMTALVVDSLAQFWRVTLPATELLLFALLPVALGWSWWRSPWLGGALTLLAIGGGGLALRTLPALSPWLLRLTNEALELWEHLGVGEFDTTFGPTIGLVLIASIALLVGLLFTGEGLRRGTAFWSIIAGLLVFGGEWAWYFERAASYFVSFMLCAMLLWTLGQTALREATWRASGRRVGYRTQISIPVAVVLATTLVAGLLPTEFAPVNLGAMGARIQEAFPVFKQFRGGGTGGGGSRFSLTTTGFSPTLGLLGGPVKLDHRVALYVSPQRPIEETLYLRGATFQTYTGTSWESGEAEAIKPSAEGILPTQYGTDVMRDPYTVKVTPAISFGRTIFNLLEPMRVDDLKSDYTPDADGNLLADRGIARNSTYTVTARLPRYSATQIRRLSTSAPSEALAPYLQRPDDLPSRIRRMAESLTQNQAHPYDKAVQIEQFLRRFSYDLNVPAAPRGQDFVDFFLFDLQRGYCTYSASAMVVLLREVGVPARLVEGFALPVTAEFTEDSRGVRTYPVYNAQAHAWVEAFFPGYGWVTFDPTPRADLPLIARNNPAPDPVLTTPTTPQSEPSADREIPVEDPFEEQEPDFGLGRTAPVQAKREVPWLLFPAVLLAALALFAYRFLARQDHLAASEGRTLVQEVWEKTGGLLARFEKGRAPHQTAQEYAETLGQAFPALKEGAAQVAQDYTHARFGPGDEPVEPVVGERAKSFWQKLHETLLTQFGWRSYLSRRLGTNRVRLRRKR